MNQPETTGYKDKNGVEIRLGQNVKHNGNLYIVKYSENLKAIILRIVDDPGMNWRDMDWLSRVAKYCEVIN